MDFVVCESGAWSELFHWFARGSNAISLLVLFVNLFGLMLLTVLFLLVFEITNARELVAKHGKKHHKHAKKHGKHHHEHQQEQHSQQHQPEEVHEHNQKEFRPCPAFANNEIDTHFG